MNGRLAVLIPAFEGGQLLRRTVASCRNGYVDRERYSVIVVDNASLKDGLRGLGPDVAVHRNSHNVGRAGNWNRALAIAEAAGFSYATFLFVGDEWIANCGMRALLDSMDRHGSVLGMAALRIVNEQNEPVRPGARVTIRGADAQVNSASLLTHAISCGRLPFAPIQANVYRLFRDRPLRFDVDPKRALNCDIEATVRFLQQHPGMVSIESQPSLLWKDRPGRFLTGQDPWSVFLETRRTLEEVSACTGIAVDWKNANAVAMLAAMRETSCSISMRARLAFQLRALNYLLSDSSGLSATKMLSLIWGKLFRGRNYLNLSAEPVPPCHSSTSLQTVVD